eukprot:scaffold29847_cov74-Cyclotella_meneghiniana.AAC.2
MGFDKQPQEDEATMQLSTPTTIQSSYGGRSSYIGSIQALSAYYDDDEEQSMDGLPFAVEDRTNNSMSFSVKNMHLGEASGEDNEDASEANSSPDEGGIVILSPDEDEENDIHWDSSQNRLEHHSEHEPLDSIIMAAAAQVDTQREEGGSFEKLMQQAESRCHEANNLEVEGESKQKSFWSRFQRSQSSSSEPVTNQSAVNQSEHHSSRPPIRTAQIAQNKFVVAVEILNSNNRTNIRDAIDILANVDLLHLWFDPIPAVFESTIKDGSGTYSPVNSNSSQNESRQRHRDGEWIEICTPPLILPKDSKISTVLRFLRVKLRSAVGFPPRIRSTILIERSAGRMGMTIGPYPDGMTAFHNFNVRMQDDCIIVSDEVQLNRSDEEHMSYHFYCFCRIANVLFKVLQWILIRWYQPDLASYMSQTSASMEKLRILIDKGEEGAYAVEEGGGDLISAPLLA